MRTRKGNIGTAAAAAPAPEESSTPEVAPRAVKTVTTHTHKRFHPSEREAVPVPSAVRLPILAAMGLAVSTVLHALAAEFGTEDIGRVARTAGGWGEVGAVVGWRTFELGVAWCGGYDAYEVAALSLFSQGPVLFLLHYFYNVSASSAFLSLAITTLSTTLPIYLVPPPTSRRATDNAPTTDVSTNILTTLLVACINSVVLATAYATYLPVTLVTYFDAIPSVAAAHTSTYVTLFPLSLLAGFAARSFICAPYTANLSTETPEFDPVAASLGETVCYNLCGYSVRMKEVFKRTAILAGLGGANTFALVLGIGGVDPLGAAAYAGVWVAAVGLSGIALGIVGDVADV